ncbi:hypothetical protein MPER_04544, partial [Moniliophthora perniciosa FA553]
LVPPSMEGFIVSTSDPSLGFTVTNCSAFFITGSVGLAHLSKTAILTPGLNGESSKVTIFNDYSPLYDFHQILYWESGLDRDQSYTVEIRATSGSSGSYIFFDALDVIDGGPNPSSKSSPSQTPSPSSVDPTRESEPLPAGSVAGITVGVVLAVITVLVLWLLRCRRRRQLALIISEASSITTFVGTSSSYP